MAIGKKELVDNLAKRLDTSKAEAQRFIDAFTEEVSEALAKKRRRIRKSVEGSPERPRGGEPGRAVQNLAPLG